MLDDKRTVQTASSSHHGDDLGAAAEALCRSDVHLGQHPVDRRGPATGPGHGKRLLKAAGYRSSAELCASRAAGRGALRRLSGDLDVETDTFV